MKHLPSDHAKLSVLRIATSGRPGPGNCSPSDIPISNKASSVRVKWAGLHNGRGSFVLKYAMPVDILHVGIIGGVALPYKEYDPGPSRYSVLVG